MNSLNNHTMAIENSQLLQLFCLDCEKRLLRVDSLLQERKGILSAEDYDLCYQEFDSLYGGARAANLSELESFFFTMAMYQRFTKRLESTESKAQAYLLTEQCMVFLRSCAVIGISTEHCSVNPERCTRYRPESLHRLIKQMKVFMAEHGKVL